MRRLAFIGILLFSTFAPFSQASASPESDFLRMAYDIHTAPVLVCIRAHESSPTPPLHNDGYWKVNSSSGAAGGYQFLPSTWDSTARQFGLFFLAGQSPQNQHFFVQDVMAVLLLVWQGAQPWAGSGCG